MGCLPAIPVGYIRNGYMSTGEDGRPRRPTLVLLGVPDCDAGASAAAASEGLQTTPATVYQYVYEGKKRVRGPGKVAATKRD